MTVPVELDRRFREAAARERLLDVAYDLTESPFGTLLVAATETGVCRISFDPVHEREVEGLARTFGARVLRTSGPVETARRELGEYFDGVRRSFELPLDLQLLRPFQHAVLRELARVPYGQTATYGQLATRIGRPRSARAVGGALHHNPIPIVLPCHRVIGSGGGLVGYAGGLPRKRALLDLEAGAGSQLRMPGPDAST